MFNKALNYLSKGRPEKALPLFKKLLKDTPYKEIYLNMGSCYKLLGDYPKAAECYLKASDPNVPFTDNTFVKQYDKALSNLGLIAAAYNNDEEAETLYRASLANNPLYYDALWNYGNALLKRYCSRKYDDLKVCWDLYEYRTKRELNPVAFKNKKKDLVLWNGIDKVKSLVVLTEQGFGDHLMFGRYLELLEPFCETLYIQCAERAEVFYSKYKTCRDPIDTDATHGVPFCSLGKIFNTGIPPGDWLKDKYVKKQPNGVLDIGVTWSGNRDHANDRNRSTSASYFRRLTSLGNLYTLNPTESGTKGFESLQSSNWSDTISELSKLDLVISVDTSIVHLCGALGMECWVLMPLIETDFRWGDNSMGFDNVWYPSVKVFRNPGDWNVVFDNVEKELAKRNN